jgi:uncharacterized membrane protein
MNNFIYLIGFFISLSIFIVLLFYRIKRTNNLEEEDLLFLNKIELQVNSLKEFILKLIKISEEEILNFFINVLEKILRRIKIIGLKIEYWASQKLEKLKKKNENI